MDNKQVARKLIRIARLLVADRRVRFVVLTSEGRGDALRMNDDEPWKVTLPSIGAFSFTGSIPELKAEVRRRAGPERVTFRSEPL